MKIFTGWDLQKKDCCRTSKAQWRYSAVFYPCDQREISLSSIVSKVMYESAGNLTGLQHIFWYFLKGTKGTLCSKADTELVKQKNIQKWHILVPLTNRFGHLTIPNSCERSKWTQTMSIISSYVAGSPYASLPIVYWHDMNAWPVHSSATGWLSRDEIDLGLPSSFVIRTPVSEYILNIQALHTFSGPLWPCTDLHSKKKTKNLPPDTPSPLLFRDII